MTLVWRPGNNAITDPDALIYIDKVEKVDGQNLEYDVAKAINDFVVGCKTDGIWDAIKACCILAGARTLDGALVPLAGTAPTSFNFVAGDYNRKTGLKGNGTNKYLSTNRNNNVEPQDNRHISIYATESHVPVNPNARFIAAGDTSLGDSFITAGSSPTFLLNVNSSSNGSIVTAVPETATGFLGVRRNSSSIIDARLQGQNASYSKSSIAPRSENYSVFGRPQDATPRFLTARLAFYSIGESLDLAALDTRVSALITAIGAAIP